MCARLLLAMGVSCPESLAKPWQRGAGGYPEILKSPKLRLRTLASTHLLSGLEQSRKTRCKRGLEAETGRYDFSARKEER